MSFTLDPTMLRAIKLAQIAGSARKIENALADGTIGADEAAEALAIRHNMRAETPRVSKTSASLDQTAQQIVSHLVAAGVDANFKTLESYPDDSKRAGEAQSVALYRDDTGHTVVLGRTKAESVLETLRTFYPND